MKAYLNRGAKIKWENTPADPEFTGEKIAELVTGKLSLDNLSDVVYLTDPPANGRLLMYQENRWVPSTVYTTNLEDVSTSNLETGQILRYDRNGYSWKNVTPTLNLADDVNITSPAEGDTIVYDATAGEWKNVPKKEWELVETLTADGLTQSLSSGILPDDTEGVYIVNNVTPGVADVVLAISVSEDDSNFTTIAGVANGIGVVARTSHVWYWRDSNLWRNYASNSATISSSNAGITERLNAIRIANNPKRIRITAPTGSVLPEDSTFEIYIKH